MKKQRQQLRGSVLVFSLLVLSMLLALTISGATVAAITKNTSRSTEKSMFAFQVADGAAEAVLKRVYQDGDVDLDAMADAFSGYIENTTPKPSCTDGVISGALSAGYGTFAVAFLENNGNAIVCSDTGWRTKLVHIKVTGSFAGTTRAIDIGIEP